MKADGMDLLIREIDGLDDEMIKMKAANKKLVLKNAKLIKDLEMAKKELTKHHNDFARAH